MNNKTSIPIGTMTIVATSDIEANRFINFEGKHCNSTDKILGISLKKCKEGELATVCFAGICVVQVMNNITTLGSQIKADENGKAAISMIAGQPIYAVDKASANGFIRVKIA